MNVLITGATGFIGRHLVNYYIKKGDVVIGAGRSIKKLRSVSNSSRYKYLLMKDDSDELIDVNVNIDVIVHLAHEGVSGSEKKSWRTQINNITNACKVVELAESIKCSKIVYVGSVDEFEIAAFPDAPFTPGNHSSIYGSVKFIIEKICKSLAYSKGINFGVAILPLTYGIGNYSKILPNVIIYNSINNFTTKLVSGNSFFDMIYIDDAIAGINEVVTAGKEFESYYVGHRNSFTFKEVVTDFSSYLTNKPTLEFGQYPDPDSGIDYRNIDFNKLYRDTGFECTANMIDTVPILEKWIIEQGVQF